MFRPVGPGRWHTAHVRRWLTVTLGLLSTVTGAGLLLGMVASPAALAVLVAVGLIVAGPLSTARPSGVRFLVGRRLGRVVVAAGGLVAGAILVAWPDPTVRTVAVVAGIWLILDGTVRVLAGFVSGGAAVVFGAVLLSWPGVTVFVVAATVGSYFVFAGVAAVLDSSRHTAIQPEKGPEGGQGAGFRAGRGAVAVVAAAVVAVLLFAGGAWLQAAQPRPDAFYTPPSQVPAAPGALLRSEPFTGGVPAGARAWRILYTTTRDDHSPAVASAVVLAATRIPPGPRPVLAWAHGATGIGESCAPSLMTDPFGGGALPGLGQALDNGWVVVATDYTGLGTRGPSPFLIGQGEARSVLDGVRAARHLTTVELGDRTVVWGHSQGGNAALWSGIIAPAYAPDAGVVGVAALAPGTDLRTLAGLWGRGSGGAVFGAYLIQAYADTYPDVRFNDAVRPAARIPTRELAGRCLTAPPLYLSGLSALLAGRSIWAADTATGAFGNRLGQNTPSGPIQAPVLIAQGETDTTVPADVQAGFVRQRCATGPVDYRTYPGRDHLGLIAADSPLIPDLLAWTQDRLAGRPPHSSCPP